MRIGRIQNDYSASGFDLVKNSGLEFVSGLSKISYLDISLFSKLLMSAGVCAFAGLSVHMQVMGVAAKCGLSLKPYIFGKFLHTVFAILYTFILLKTVPFSKSAFLSDMGTESLSAGFFICAIYSTLTVISLFSMLVLYLTGTVGKAIKSKKHTLTNNLSR